MIKERDTYILCCNCGLAGKKRTMFIKSYQNTAICLCKKCAKKLQEDIQEHLNDKENKNGN